MRTAEAFLLTGCRLNEVVGMRRDELSEDGATWIIPVPAPRTAVTNRAVATAVRDILSGIQTKANRFHHQRPKSDRLRLQDQEPTRRRNADGPVASA